VLVIELFDWTGTCVEYAMLFSEDPRPCILFLCWADFQAISRQALQPRQHSMVEAFFTQQNNDANGISAYIAGNVKYTLTRSRYGKRAVSTLSNTFYNKSEFFSDSSAFSLYSMTLC
jgi:hypothetical protein